MTAEPVDPKPSAIYSLIEVAMPLESEPQKSRVALHAAAPTPDRVEFENLKEDLVKGSIRRRATFQWHDNTVAQSTNTCTTLTKFDRSGGAQLPVTEEGIHKSD